MKTLDDPLFAPLVSQAAKAVAARVAELEAIPGFKDNELAIGIALGVMHQAYMLEAIKDEGARTYAVLAVEEIVKAYREAVRTL